LLCAVQAQVLPVVKAISPLPPAASKEPLVGAMANAHTEVVVVVGATVVVVGAMVVVVGATVVVVPLSLVVVVVVELSLIVVVVGAMVVVASMVVVAAMVVVGATVVVVELSIVVVVVELSTIVVVVVITANTDDAGEKNSTANTAKNKMCPFFIYPPCGKPKIKLLFES